MKLSEDIRTIKGYKVRTVHALKLAIINPEVWEKYEEWLEEVIKDGTEPEVKEFQKREKEKAAAEAAYQEKRTAAKEEYRRLVEAGELRDKTIIEKTLTRAQGHPDNESVQAARRICEKRGYDWRTGEKIPAFKTKGLKLMKKKIVTACLVVALLVVGIVGASLAYFTDKDKAENTFTVGKVKIQLNEQQRNADGTALEAFEQNKALKNLNTKGNKEAIEREFTAWVNADPARKATYGEVLPMIRQGYEDIKEYSVATAYAQEALAGPEAHLFAYRSGRMIEDLCDKEIPAGEKTEIKEALKDMAKAFFKDYNADLDTKLFAALFKIYNDNVDPDLYPEVIDLVNKKYKGNYDKFAAGLQQKSIFMDEAAFNAFLDKPDCKQLAKDPVYIAGKSFYEIWIKLTAYSGEMQEKISKGDRLFVRGLMEMQPDKAWAPNANSTIRLTYGKVGSYKPRDAVFYDYYTTLTGVIEKEGPKGGEFEVPDRLKELYAQQDFAPYGTDKLSVNFITDNDITGGNSGSGVINAEGHLIGTAFDGNSEAMSGDIDFEENLQRCINLDTRYFLWIVDKYAGAKNLINEMTIIK